MKFVKSIGLFVIYPFFMMTFGFFIGMMTYRFFYPNYGNMPISGGMSATGQSYVLPSVEPEKAVIVPQGMGEDTSGEVMLPAAENSQETAAKEQNPSGIKESGGASEAVIEVVGNSEKLSADTKYILIENDLKEGTTTQSESKIPHKYIGMNRQQFLTAMENYEASPPLSEREKGFVSLQVLNFARDRVVVQMNYELPEQEEAGYYLGVYNNEVVVYFEDKATVYINTGIALESLPEEVQREVIRMLRMEDDEALFGFLEAYSS